MEVRDRPVSLWVLVAVLGQLSARAVVGGLALVLSPSGSIVGLSTAPLAATPFADFLVPGVVLLGVFGVGSAGVCYSLAVGRVWGWWGAVGVGVALLVWIAVEVAVGFVRPTVVLNAATALAVLALAMSPGVRRVSFADHGSPPAGRHDGRGD